MKLTKEQLTNIALGTAYITEEEKGVHFHRFTKEQENYYKETNNNFYLKALGTAGVKLSFKTDSKALFIKGTTTEHPSRKYYSLDVEKDGKIIGSINNFEGAELASPYTVSELQTGDFSKSFDSDFIAYIVPPIKICAPTKIAKPPKIYEALFLYVIIVTIRIAAGMCQRIENP